MEFDLKSLRGELDAICVRRGVLKLSLFGSAVDGSFDPFHSDLDFTVEFREMTPVEHKRAYFGLVRDLELLFGRDVDVIESRTILNPYLLQSIEDSQHVVYATA